MLTALKRCSIYISKTFYATVLQLNTINCQFKRKNTGTEMNSHSATSVSMNIEHSTSKTQYSQICLKIKLKIVHNMVTAMPNVI